MLHPVTDRRVDKLIHLLVKNATVVVPGPKIASQIGVTRSTVWMYIEKLRSLGVEIKGHHSSGYQLRTLPDILAPSLIRTELGENEIGHKIVHYFRIESTNDVALALAAQGAEHGTVVLAEEQTAGRGRFGRTWFSEKSSGIYVSVVLRPDLPPAAAPALTLLAGVAAHRAITAAAGLAADIRWPNDLLVNGKKVCGILTEMSAELGRLHYVVLGIGINVNQQTMPAEIESAATSLRLEGGRFYSRQQILVSLLKELDKYYRAFLDRGTEPIIRAWAEASSYAAGKKIRVHSRNGDFEAVTVGLASDGSLRIRRENGLEESLVAGEIAEVK
ncbi:MAG: biotin--[acetyl-CoA-carboxylase] ligase [Terriglobia bacterium]|jgi:BirA family biotin operon repressor/biotin-[acetyl-CoA-carboxylase] ligase